MAAEPTNAIAALEQSLQSVLFEGDIHMASAQADEVAGSAAAIERYLSSKGWILIRTRPVAVRDLVFEDPAVLRGLLEITRQVRTLQKSYFKNRTRENLVASKELEARLDKLLAAMFREGPEPQLPA